MTTITAAELEAKAREAGLWSDTPMREEVKTADKLAVGDAFLVTSPENRDDAVLFTVKRVIVGKYDLKPGTRAIVGVYGMGGELHKASFVANDYDEFTILV